jgi:Zn-dependent protease
MVHPRIRPSPVFLLVLALTAVGGDLAWTAVEETRTARIGVFLFVVAGSVATLSLHEFAHALTAFLSGDREVEQRGYLTLNPLRYTHPLLSVALPVLFIAIGGFGLPGGAVYLRPHLFRANWQRAVVSFAGPAVNLAAAVVLLAVLRTSWPWHAHESFFAALAFLALLQITMAVLNLLPIPGLDGFGIISPYLDQGVRRGAEQIGAFGILIVLGLLQVHSFNVAFFHAVRWLFELSGVPSDEAATGFRLLRFWMAS